MIHFATDNWAVRFHYNVIFAAILDDGLLLAERLKLGSSLVIEDYGQVNKGTPPQFGLPQASPCQHPESPLDV